MLSTQFAPFVDAKRVRRKFGITRVDQVRQTPWHVLRGNSGFRWYFFGSVTSDFGTWLQSSAQVLLAYQLAHSVLTVGLVTFAQFTSPLLLGPWAGVMADRFGGRRTLFATQLVSASVSGILACLDFAGGLQTWLLVSGAIASGLAFTFALPARNITVHRLVPDVDQLKAAYAMDSVSYNLGRALAPTLTIIMALAGISFAWAFTANAVTFIAFSAIIWLLNMHSEQEPERRSRLRDGFRAAWSDKRIRILLLMVAAVTIADDPIMVLGPELARQLHASPAWSGWFIAALGAGSVIGSFRRSKHQPAIRLAATALAALALCMLIFVFAPAMWLACLAALGAGASCLVANSVTRSVLVQAAGPERFAPVMAVWAIAWAGSKPFASLIDGALGATIGPQWTGVLLAAPALIPVLLIVLLPKIVVLLAGRRPMPAPTPNPDAGSQPRVTVNVSSPPSLFIFGAKPVITLRKG